MRIKKGDTVQVIAGKDKGLKGEVMQTYPKKDKVVVDGAFLIKKHIKSPNKNEKGQRIEMPAPIHISNVLLYCSKCKKGVRVGTVINEKGVKKRVCKKCNNEI